MQQIDDSADHRQYAAGGDHRDDDQTKALLASSVCARAGGLLGRAVHGLCGCGHKSLKIKMWVIAAKVLLNSDVIALLNHT